MASRIAVLILPLMIGACSHSVDFTKLDLCRRVLPALHPDQTVLREIRFVGAGEGGIRIDYQAREPGRDARTHQTTCRFEKNDLAAVEIDHRPLGDARFLFLKRFWLAPLGGGHDLEVAGPPVPEWPDAVAYAVQQLASGMVLAAIYGLLATAFSLVYGLAGRINLAFGEIATLGAYGAVGGAALAPAFGWHSPVAGLSVALVVATWLACLWNWLIGRAVIVPLHARHRLGQPILIATAAAAVAIQEFLRVSQGAREHVLSPFFGDPIALAHAGRFMVTVTPMQLLAGASGLAAAGAILWLFFRTAFGRDWRAFADDPVAAAMFGVASDRIFARTFLLAGLSAGLAGWIVAVYYGNVSFAMGGMLGLKALLAAVLGGIGNIPGAFIGGLLIGVIEAGWSAYFDIASRDMVLFVLLIAILVLRPGGLLGMAEPGARRI